MATASDTRRARWLLVVAAVVVIVGIAVIAVTYDSSETSAEPDPVAVVSSARHQFATLADLIAASDLVVSGRVVAAEPGRVFGAGAADLRGPSNGIRSHVLTLRVERVLAGDSGASAPALTVLVEEEASLGDGTPVVVDGMRGGRVGDDGIWFLVASRDPEFPGFALVNAQGRYLKTPAGLRGGDRSDALVRALEDYDPNGLSDLIVANAALRGTARS